ncbi:uncharacterized protein LOC114476433 [Gouania willdenowi]|uniref:uncharacterized protein LOC114459825 n=2 Tax=Gouania willdenowi TaxID=441366 RepID=UPI0010562BEE|nr:uncharacterized protein LOC114459825 [Gouania willdenowi]XP_028303955.1 uncharacterized protein LOC114464084 [Gouania willdenowi]XP_028306090.1 uncharacterized protein LOC114465343 [Gouania willdenowi]XP_028307549.1 uncharacterized protein LOC114466183 [Gouania willdenowi]XP_028314311.1 uncharacterized protein LOC114470346 [Gouania willdenowi]XP_028315354.1 uncharacterized protein LOC114471033 [Gouania willdenowi]XP_028317598.1 uncharacterized protein LOC114472493 [Gouania willdenowi]XP_0
MHSLLKVPNGNRMYRGGVRVRGGRGAGQGGRGGRGGVQGGRARQPRTIITDEMRATVIDHVIVHGMSLREAGLRVQPNLSRFSVSTIIRAFRQHNRVERLPHHGGRAPLFTAQQEILIVDMVRENNIIRLREIKERVIADNINFGGIDRVSLATIDRVLRRQKLRMKQAYRVPFERNSDRIKELRFQYVQRILGLDAMMRQHEYIFLDEAGFNLTKRRRRGRNIIGQRAIVDVPGQRGGNITLCAAMTSEGLLHRQALLGSFNTQRLLTFLGDLRDILIDREQQNLVPAQPPPIYVIIWDNVSFHRTNQIREWFNIHQQFLNVCLPPYSPFLNPIEEFFSSWRWKVYDRQPYSRENLLRAMDLACDDVGDYSGWVRHARAFFPRCLARENIACDVDEVLWPDPTRRRDAQARAQSPAQPPPQAPAQAPPQAPAQAPPQTP